MNLDPGELALRRLGWIQERLSGDQPTREQLAGERASAEDYLDGCSRSVHSDTLEGIRSFQVLIDYINALLADEQLRRDWVEGRDISPALRELFPNTGIYIPTPHVLDLMKKPAEPMRNPFEEPGDDDAEHSDDDQ